MTALIIGLIAALGIGGGIAVANNSGGGGGGGTEISGPAVPGDDGGSGNEGENQGGDNTGGNQGGSDNPGSDNTGGNQGGNQGGSDNPGGDNTGGNQGSGNEGGDNPGGNNPGNPASKLNPDYNLISALTDNTQYKNIAWVNDCGPTEYTLIKDGLKTNYRSLKLGEDGESFVVDTGVLAVNDGAFVLDSDGKFMEEKQTLRFTAADKINETSRYDVYQKNTSPSVRLNGSPITHLHKLYLGGAKAGLSTADFGFRTEWRNGDSNTWYDLYQMFYLYDNDYLYTGSKTDAVSFAGSALMVAEDMDGPEEAQVLPGAFSMNLNMADATLSGKINMGDSKYNVDFSGILTEQNHLKFTGQDVAESSQGYLLQGKDELETVGNIVKYLDYATENRTAANYTFGAKEVK